MRVLMTVSVPMNEGNAAFKSGKLQQIIKKFVDENDPEAAYFGANDTGERGAIFVFDLNDPSEMPRIAEPLFQELNARVRFQPIMTLEDLTKGLGAFERGVAALN